MNYLTPNQAAFMLTFVGQQISDACFSRYCGTKSFYSNWARNQKRFILRELKELGIE